MHGPRRIGILIYEGVNALDVAGPLEAFTSAPADADGQPAYERVVMAAGPSLDVTTESGLGLHAAVLAGEAAACDTLIVPGGCGVREPETQARIVEALRRHAPAARRIASVCTGAFALAAAGLLDGRRATTHWRFASLLAEQFPTVRVDDGPIHLRDGHIYTSAGVTAGVDLSLALIEEDLGPAAALAVARELVVYLRRPGGQAQFSEPLNFQARAGARFSELAAWIATSLSEDLSVEALAARAGMAPRTFARQFREVFGTTPASYVEALRVQAAQDRLSVTSAPAKQVGASVGFASPEVFGRAFLRRLGVTPAAYRASFSLASQEDQDP